MSLSEAQTMKTNMMSIFLPTFLAVVLAVPVAAAMTFMIIRSDRAYAISGSQNADSSVNVASPATSTMCVVPAVSTPSTTTPVVSTAAGTPVVYMGGYYAPLLLPTIMAGSTTQNQYETITTTTYNYNDSYNSGSYNRARTTTTTTNSSNTQSWVDSHDNTQAWDNSNQGNPVTTTNTAVTTVTDNSVTF